jgi:transcriptional regulator with GAF, ATPase, and Fis domain
MTRAAHSYDRTIRRIREVRAQAIEHTRKAQELAVERRDLMRALVRDGYSQADIARELGVTRQAIQKMMSI